MIATEPAQTHYNNAILPNKLYKVGLTLLR